MALSVLPLLRLLADGQYHRVDEINAALGMDVGDAQRAVRVLCDGGLRVEQAADSGYRLATPFTALSAARINDGLGARASCFTLDLVDETGSTNDDLLRRARSGASSGLVRVAEVQSAGRGRQHRKWVSAPGGSLTFSLLWEFEQAQRLAGLSLAVGVSLVRSLTALHLEGVELKWPNDLLWRQRKLGGVLIETIGGSTGRVSAVIGIGLNFRLFKPLADQIDQPVADLESAGLRVERNELLARLLFDLYDVLGTFADRGFAALRAEWQRCHGYQDKMVCLDMPGAKRPEGRVVGVNDDGALLLATASGTQAFHGGELSLRLVGPESG